MGAAADALRILGRFRFDRPVRANRSACTRVGKSTSVATSALSPNGTRYGGVYGSCRPAAAKRAFRNPLVHASAVPRHHTHVPHRLSNALLARPVPVVASEDHQHRCWPAPPPAEHPAQSKVVVSQCLIAKRAPRTTAQVKSTPTWPETVGSLAIRSRHSSISAESRPTTLATASSRAARTAHWCIFGHGSSSASPSS